MRLLPLILCLSMVPFVAPPAAHAADRRTPVVLAVERATPAVVTVEVEVERQNPWSFWGGRQLAASEGSGVVIRKEGVVLTNAHVVEGARTVHVRLADGRRLEARVMALEADLDLAVLRVQGGGSLPTITVGDSDDLMLGETAIAIGNPLGLGLTVSTGVVASTGRDVEIQPGITQTFVQTDAAINPGNSGGALVNINGELIGINTAIRADAEGIGFAIPVNRAIKIAADLVDFGSVQAPWLGADLDDAQLRSRRAVVVVTAVLQAGPAGRAGMRPGDVITHVDGRAVASRADLNARLAERNPGATLKLTLLRDGRTASLSVRSTAVPTDAGVTVAKSVLGIELSRASGGQGVVVSRASASGVWVREGLRAGDIIVAIDGRNVQSDDDVFAILQRAKAQHRGAALFTLRRGSQFGRLRLPLR